MRKNNQATLISQARTTLALVLHEHRLILREVALQSLNGDDVDRLTAMVRRGGHTILDERFANVSDANVAGFRFPELFLDESGRNVCFVFQVLKQNSFRS